MRPFSPLPVVLFFFISDGPVIFFLFLKLNHSLFMDDLNFVTVIGLKFTV